MAKRQSQLVLPKRRSCFRPQSVALRIYCNGETEKLYFEGLRAELRLQSVVVIKSSEYNRRSLVDKVKRLLREDDYVLDEQHEVWLLFDVDALPDGRQTTDIEYQTDEAVNKCRRLGYTPVVSNDAFELWLFLHFEYCDSHLHRWQLQEKVKEKIPGYDKALPVYDNHLKGEPVEKAIKNATTLCGKYDDDQPFSQRKPYTNAHELVLRMRSLAAERAL